MARPQITDQEKDVILHKIEPYLKAGLSVRKALSQTQVPSSTFYKLMETDKGFMEQIHSFQQFLSVLLSTAFSVEMYRIANKQHNGQSLSKDDVELLKWFELNSNLTKDEFGRRIELQSYDPEIEIRRIAKLIDDNCRPGRFLPN